MAGRDGGLSIGLYRDLAVGADPNGAEAWADQELVATGASIGAPPDAFNQTGQNWGLAPVNPLALRRGCFAPFVAAIRANMLTYSIWAGNYALVIPRQQREVFLRAGWTKQDVREYVFESARVVRRMWRDVGKAAIAGRRDEDRVYTALRTPDDLLVVSAGGPAGGFAAIVPPWYGNKSLAVTWPIAGAG